MAGGKVIGGRPGTLVAAGLKPGAKLMLLAAAGATSQGQAALEAARQGRQAALERGRQQLSERAWGGAGAGAAPAPSIAQRAETWAKTGIAALRDLKLTQLPGELFGAAVAAKLRVLDCGGNALSALPPALGTLTALQRLRLSLNRLDDAGLPPQLLAGLRQLAILALDDNRLTTLPACVCGLAALQKLSLNGNQLGERRAAGLAPAGASTTPCSAACQPLSLLTPLQPACRMASPAWRSCACLRCGATAWRRCRPLWGAAASCKSWMCGTTSWRRCRSSWGGWHTCGCCWRTTTGERLPAPGTGQAWVSQSPLPTAVREPGLACVAGCTQCPARSLRAAPRWPR